MLSRWIRTLACLVSVVMPLCLHGGGLEHRKAIVIVDGYSTGKYLAPMFRGHGYAVVHVASAVKRTAGSDLASQDYIDHIQQTDGTSKILEHLARYQVLAVVAGAEEGVPLADELANKLKLPTSNSLGKSLARRNKYEMQNALQAQGLASIKQFKSNDVEKIIAWSKAHGVLPMVLKPIASCGTDGVSYCRKEEDIHTAFKNILSAANFFGETNTEVLAQELVVAKEPGVEYMVNSVSSFGNHYIAEIWKTKKRAIGKTPFYDYAELISPFDPEFEILEKYTMSVLDALEIRHGAGHSEIMLTTRGPVLIETAARLGGGFDPSSLMEATGHSQVSLLVDSYLRPDHFAQICAGPRKKLNNHILISFLASEIEGVAKYDLTKKKLTSLPH